MFLLGGPAHGQWYEPLLERDRQLRAMSHSSVTLPMEEPFGYYYRLLQISGRTDRSISFMMRPAAIPGGITASHPWESGVQASDRSGKGLQLGVVNPVWFTSWNSAIPRGGNDGALWQGRGLNTSHSFGARVSYGSLVVQLRPVLVYSQNRDFDLMPYSTGTRSEYTYPLRVIDYAQRFGNQAYGRVDAGESFIEVRLRAWALGGGHGRHWTGPAVTYPLLYSYNAPGFWHVRLGTWRPAQTPLGDFEFRYVAGVLKHSEFFQDSFTDRIKTNHLIIGVWSPSFIRGFSMGLQRMYVDSYIQEPLKDLRDFLLYPKIFDPSRKDILNSRDPVGDGSDPDNQIMTAFARWQFPEAGFEVYGEYGRNDHYQNRRDLRLQPDHARAYMLGFIKVFYFNESSLLAINAEVTQLGDMRSSIARGGPIPNHAGSVSWYAHSRNPFTHRGKILGAASGPGANTRLLRADLFYPGGRYGLRLTRVLYNNTIVHNSFATIRNAQPDEVGLRQRDVRQAEFQVAVEHTRFLNRYGMEIDAMVEFGHTLNHYYLYQNDVSNLRLMLTVRRFVKGWLR
jgi:hypothetical protein